jgi:hypothetical protein
VRADLLAELCAVMRRPSPSKTPVTPETPVTDQFGYMSKPLMLHELHALQVKSSDLGKGNLSPVTAPVTKHPSEDDSAFHERAGMAADSVPAVYLDAWARLNCKRPANVTEAAWRQALDDGGRFLDAWGSMAAEEQWAVDEIFDVPRAGSAGGLIWEIAGRAVEAFGPECARFDDGEMFERSREATVGR